jgi:predicted Zn-dependent protease with MMP-like domain/Tfp pilus assembly protein PilF
VLTLLGAIAAGHGDIDAALAHYQKASALDPDFIDPLLHAAELQIFPLGDYEEAVRLCDHALDLAEEEEEFLDALLLKAEAQAAAGDEAGARATLEELPPVRLPEAQFHVRAGRIFLDLGELDEAEGHFRAALNTDAAQVDAQHALGLVYEARGDEEEMVAAFRKVRAADLREPPAPWHIDAESFERIAQSAFDALPDSLRSRLENVPILCADYPSAELVDEGTDPRILGFFDGVPFPEKESAPPHLDCIHLYQRNIERICRGGEDLQEEIRRTLIHETGHFFGLTEEELEALDLD